MIYKTDLVRLHSLLSVIKHLIYPVTHLICRNLISSILLFTLDSQPLM